MCKKLLLLSFLAMNVAYSQTSQDREAILKILDRQTQRWNVGDIDSFMKGYWENDSLMYIGKGGITYGYQPTLNSYKKRYSNKALMGTLAFEIKEVKFQNKDVCFVVGKWHLSRPDAGDIGGHYSLLWRKIKGEWVIVADHSS